MKKKILAIGVLSIAFTIASSAYAANENSGNAFQPAGDVGQAVPTANQPIRGSQETNKQVQNQNQVQNQGETTQLQNMAQEKEGLQGQNNPNSQTAERRSRVANAVQEMMKVGDRQGGIGQQIKLVAQNQNQNHEKIEAGLNKIQSRNSFVKFFVGPNYGEINTAKKIMNQNREELKQMNSVDDKATNPEDKEILVKQIQALNQANSEVETALDAEEKGFSLFGWMFKAFSA